MGSTTTSKLTSFELAVQLVAPLSRCIRLASWMKRNNDYFTHCGNISGWAVPTSFFKLIHKTKKEWCDVCSVFNYYHHVNNN